MANPAATQALDLPEVLINQVFTAISDGSKLARLAPPGEMFPQGVSILTLNRTSRSKVVAEGDAKPESGAAFGPKVVRPHTFVYSGRVSNQFVKAAEEVQANYLEAFFNGASAQIAKDFDWVALQGTQPGTNTAIPDAESFASTVTASVENSASTSVDVYGDILDAENLVNSAGAMPTGTVLSALASSALRKPASGSFLFPPGTEVNPLGTPTVVTADAGDSLLSVVGDFTGFAWGVSIQDFQVIPYGDPDGGGDLARHNQVLLRLEVGYGWGILDPSLFATVKAAATETETD